MMSWYLELLTSLSEGVGVGAFSCNVCIASISADDLPNVDLSLQTSRKVLAVTSS